MVSDNRITTLNRGDMCGWVDDVLLGSFPALYIVCFYDMRITVMETGIYAS